MDTIDVHFNRTGETQRMTVDEFLDNYQPDRRTLKQRPTKDVYVPGLVALVLIDVFFLLFLFVG